MSLRFVVGITNTAKITLTNWLFFLISILWNFSPWRPNSLCITGTRAFTVPSWKEPHKLWHSSWSMALLFCSFFFTIFIYVKKRSKWSTFFSFERSGLSPKVKMMHQLSQKLISSICKYTAYSSFHFKCSCVWVGCNPSTNTAYVFAIAHNIGTFLQPISTGIGRWRSS